MLRKRKDKQPTTIQVKQKVNEFQLFLPINEVIIPLGYCKDEKEAKRKAEIILFDLNTSAYLMQKRLVKTSNGKALEMYWKDKIMQIKRGE